MGCKTIFSIIFIHFGTKYVLLFLSFLETMPQIYQRKTKRGSPLDVLERAAESVRGGASIRGAAIEFSVNRMTLKRYIEKYNRDQGSNYGYKKCVTINMVFTNQMEKDFSNHIKQLAKMFNGLSKEKTLRLAFEFAVENKLNIPQNWVLNKKAGEGFWFNFKARNKLSIRRPEATSLGRATAFNKHTVNLFFNNLKNVYEQFQFRAQDVFNLDETGVHTVMTPGAVVTERGTKQVGSVTSAERGELVTLVYAISAAGTVLPPFFIFPRVHYKQHFVNGGPEGSSGSARTGGWMNEDIFLEYLNYFVSHVRSSHENKVLLIMDNLQAHISIQTIDFAKNNGVVLLTIPPHTSHKLQPLDVTCFGPFKRAFSVAMDDWMRTNPGRTVTIYDLPKMVTTAHTMAFTQANIQSGFRNTGIFPENSLIFSDEDFIPANVTDRLDPELEEDAHERFMFVEEPAVDLPELDLEMTTGPSTSTSISPTAQRSAGNVTDTPTTSSSTPPQSPQHTFGATPTTSLQQASTSGIQKYVSPSELLPFPKAGPRKRTQRRNKKTSLILTDTPIRNKIASEKAAKSRKPSAAKRSIFTTTQLSSNSEEDMDISEACGLGSDSSDNDDGSLELGSIERVDVGDFIICQIATKKTISYFVAQVLENVDEDFDLQVKYLKRRGKQNVFIFSNEEPASLPIGDVRFILPNPNSFGTTSRTKDIFSFNVNFGDLNIS